MTYKPGQSGNPAGRPKGTKDRRTELREMLQPHAKDLIQRCVALALQGDTTALRICMDRLVSPVREDPMRASVPKIESMEDCATAQAAVIAACAAGDMLPSEAQLLSGLIEAQRRAYESSDLAKRLDALERQITQASGGVPR